MANPNAEGWAWWADMWSNAQWVRAMKNSFIIGIAATLIATALGTLAADRAVALGDALQARRDHVDPDLADDRAAGDHRRRACSRLLALQPDQGSARPIVGV